MEIYTDVKDICPLEKIARRLNRDRRYESLVEELKLAYLFWQAKDFLEKEPNQEKGGKRYLTKVIDELNKRGISCHEESCYLGSWYPFEMPHWGLGKAKIEEDYFLYLCGKKIRIPISKNPEMFVDMLFRLDAHLAKMFAEGWPEIEREAAKFKMKDKLSEVLYASLEEQVDDLCKKYMSSDVYSWQYDPNATQKLKVELCGNIQIYFGCGKTDLGKSIKIYAEVSNPLAAVFNKYEDLAARSYFSKYSDLKDLSTKCRRSQEFLIVRNLPFVYMMIVLDDAGEQADLLKYVEEVREAMKVVKSKWKLKEFCIHNIWP